MTDFSSATTDMVTDLLTENGESFTYSRAGEQSTETVEMLRSSGPSMFLEVGDGQQTEVRPEDFICLTSALPFGDPKRGDRITDGVSIFEVMPTTSEKVFRRISPTMTRVSTQQIR